jgi:hypothetical protein
LSSCMSSWQSSVVKSLQFSRLQNLGYRYFIELLGWGISPLQSLSLHKTTYRDRIRTCIHALSGIRTHDLSVWPTDDSTCQTQYDDSSY